MNIRAFAKPAEGQFHLLMRVPFTGINDIQFPLTPDGYLDFDRIGTVLPGAARYWIANNIQVFENGAQLPRPAIAAARVSLPSDRSFDSFNAAVGQMRSAALPASTQLVPSQAYLDVLLDYPIRSERSDFSIRTNLQNLAARVWMDLKFMPPDGPPRALSWEGDPGIVRLNPGDSETTWQFLSWGFMHLFSGADYLLFLFCLLLPFRTGRAAFSAGCAFAAASAITLAASALGQAPDQLWFTPFVETSIAVLILYAALDNIAGFATLWRRVVAAAVSGIFFGFSFGFGFAAKAQYGGTHPVLAGAAFGAGLEGAVIVAVAAILPLVNLLTRITPAKRMEAIVISALAAHTAWHWMTERWSRLSRFPFRWPALDAAFLAAAMRWVTILLVVAGALWLISGLFQPKADKTSAGRAA